MLGKGRQIFSQPIMDCTSHPFVIGLKQHQFQRSLENEEFFKIFHHLICPILYIFITRLTPFALHSQNRLLLTRFITPEYKIEKKLFCLPVRVGAKHEKIKSFSNFCEGLFHCPCISSV